MVAVVYYSPVKSRSPDEINKAVKNLLTFFESAEKFSFERKVLLKVSFGEAGNKTFVPSNWMLGAIDFLENKKIDTGFIETNVLYRGRRTNKDDHIKLAKEHGFTQLPITIADGNFGEDFVDVEIDKFHFKSCMIAKKIVDEKQLLVVNHFKGHQVAGFGGAIKQLAMGCASRGGKLAQHAGSIPIINPLKCKKCDVCVSNCPTHAIKLGSLSARIDKAKCIGCAACIALCPHGAIGVNWFNSVKSSFTEKLVEYAHAAQLGKNNVYLSYALNMTSGCDCVGKDMKPITDDLGIFVSSDPLAIDKAVFDLLRAREGKDVFSEKKTFSHAKKIGLGSVDYELVKVD